MTAASFKQLSVIIPVGPNDPSWQGLLNELAVFGTELEIILSACEKKPANIELASNIRWVHSAKGRATQLNAGASHAIGDYFWFLHADTAFSQDVLPAVKQYMETADDGLAYFKLKFADDGPRQTSLNAWAANIRSRFFGLPFGDQGFVLQKTIFQQMKGFDESISLGEDLDFVVRLQAANMVLQELPAYLITSARRYQQQGWIATTFRHLWLTWQLTRQAKQRLRFVV